TKLTGPYELWCPGTPVGTVVLDGVTTSASITPASPSSGSTFQVTNYQTTATIPAALATAAYAIDPELTGNATTSIDLAGATPASMSSGSISFSHTITVAEATSGFSLVLPSTPLSLGPFTAKSTGITVVEDPTASLTLVVSGAPITLPCTAYPNNSNPSQGGVVAAGTPPVGQPIAPVIATAGGGSTETPTTSAISGGSGTTTTAATTSASSGQLAYTGFGSGSFYMSLVGLALVLLGFALLALADVPRRTLHRLAVAMPGRRPARYPSGRETRRTRHVTADIRESMSSMGHAMQSMGHAAGTNIGRIPKAGANVAHNAARGARHRVARATSWLLGR
ncbi:MAG TPA: hypothetical protein VEH82_04370, partial [Acidimicrobiales bacterium]|nr:hypothetical protein [Acidimicrobiales bacterium]